MQRKTKFKIIFYSIGFISFALLPYVITKQEAEQNQRYAQLPSYNNADTVNPFLSRLKKAGSSLADLFRKSGSAAATDQAAEQTISEASVDALKQAAEKEVLASLSPNKTTAATATKTLASSTAPTAGSAASAMAAPGEEPPQAPGAEAAAQEARNQALLSARNAAGSAGFPNSSDTRNVLNQKGYNQAVSPLNNNVYARSKNGALEDLIAQSDAQLVRSWRNNKNTRAKSSGKSSKSSGFKSSFKMRFAKAKNALKNAAVARAKAKQHSYGYAGTPISAVPVSGAQVQYEMGLQQQELQQIFQAQHEISLENETQDNTPYINQIIPVVTYFDSNTPSQGSSGPTGADHLSDPGGADNPTPMGASNPQDSIFTSPSVPAPQEGKKRGQEVDVINPDYTTGFNEFDVFDKEEPDDAANTGPIIFVLDEGDKNYYEQALAQLQALEAQEADGENPQELKEIIGKREKELEVYNNLCKEGCIFVANPQSENPNIVPLREALPQLTSIAPIADQCHTVKEANWSFCNKEILEDPNVVKFFGSCNLKGKSGIYLLDGDTCKNFNEVGNNLKTMAENGANKFAETIEEKVNNDIKNAETAVAVSNAGEQVQKNMGQNK